MSVKKFFNRAKGYIMGTADQEAKAAAAAKEAADKAAAEQAAKEAADKAAAEQAAKEAAAQPVEVRHGACTADHERHKARQP